MLTEDDKDRIKSEEIFRDEIRKTLTEKDQSSFRKKSWKLINSPFGLWLFSTVLVGLTVYFFNNNKAQNEISVNNAATMQKLEIETSNRLQQFKLALSNQDPSKIYYQKEDLAYMVDGILIKDGSPQKKPIYIFPEYKERTMNSLLYEIGRLTKDKKQGDTITVARTILTKIQNSLLTMEDLPRPIFSVSQRIQQISQVQPENLSSTDAKILAEYQKKLKDFDENELAKYNTRIKKKLDDLLKSFQGNVFLKEMANK